WTRTTRYCTASWYPKSATSPTTTRRSQPSADCLNRGDSDVPSVCKIDNGWKQIWRGSAFAVDAPARRNCNKHISSHKVYYVKCCIATFTACCPGSGDRKSTRLNSSHVKISYAVFCLKKKKNKK